MQTASSALYSTGLALVVGGLLTGTRGVGLIGVVALVASGIVEATDRHRLGDHRLTPKEAAAVLLSSLEDDRG